MVAAAMVLIAGCGPTATSAGQLGWRVVATVPGRDNVTELFGVTAAGTSAAWATGISEQRGTSTVVPVLESWSGSAWSRVTLPRAVAAKLGSDPRLGAVAASGPHDVWAFGPRGAWLHGSGSVWTAGMISRSPVDVRSALAFGSDTVWALGGLARANGRSVPFAAYQGPDGWIRTTVPGQGTIVDASAVSASDFWATVQTLTPGGRATSDELAHWQRGRWQTVTGLPAVLRSGSFGAVLAFSDADVWLGGARKNGMGGTTETVGHWNGHRWTVTTLRVTASPARYAIARMVPDGSGGIWALGVREQGTAPEPLSRLWHETGDIWTLPYQPRLTSASTMVIGLAAAGRSVWAVGMVRAANHGTDGLIALWGR